MQVLARLVFHVPILGWMLKEAVHGPVTAKLLFVANMVLLWLLAIYVFGYPAIIIPALAAVLFLRLRATLGRTVACRMFTFVIAGYRPKTPDSDRCCRLPSNPCSSQSTLRDSHLVAG